MGHPYNVEIIDYNRYHTNNAILEWSANGRSAMASGWGRTEDELPSPRLKYGEIEFFPGPMQYEGVLLDHRLLLANKTYGSWTCKGDSGGKK